MKMTFFILPWFIINNIIVAAPREMNPGSEQARWAVKTSVDVQQEPHELTLEDLFDLPDAPGVKSRDARYTKSLIPEFSNDLGVKEGDLITVEGWLHLVAWEEDGDYHMQLSADPQDGNNCLIAEVPIDDPEFVADGNLRVDLAEVREIVDNLMPRGKPSTGGTILRGPVYVRITGQLFYDDWHVGQATMRGKKGMKAVNLWELHPVISMEVLSSTVHDFDEIEPTAGTLTNYTASGGSDSGSNPPQTPSEILAVILLGALLGITGQGIRIAVGLKKLNDASENKEQFDDQFDIKKLIVSLLYAVTIGVISGILMAVERLDTVWDKTTILAVIAAGYAGADFIEGFMSRNLPAASEKNTATPVKTPSTAPEGTPKPGGISQEGK